MNIMEIKAFLVIGVCSLFISRAVTISLPYEVKATLLTLLKEKDLNDLDTSKRSIAPIYRKDLDPNYIAYYEILVHGKHFFVLSSGPKTGDYREVASGPGPMPTKVLSDQAKKVGQTCKKFYLLSSMGLYMCENQDGRAVAASYNWIADAPISHWTHLQKMVEDSLADFAREWKKVAASVKEEWKTSQRKAANQKPGLWDYDADIVSPGSTAKVALEKDHGKVTIHAIPATRQRQLCEILDNVCTGASIDVNKDLIPVETKKGINFLKFKVKEDSKKLRKILNNQEITFYFKVLTKDGQQILTYFSLDLSVLRRRGWSKWRTWKVKREHQFPEYNQHKCCGCYTGCGPVAWASILGFYDRLAHYYPSSGYSKRFWYCSDGNNCIAPKYMNSNVRKYVRRIRKMLGTFCLFGGGATTPKGMKRIIKFYRARGIGGRIYSHYGTFSWAGVLKGWVRNRAASHIKAGYPAIIGVWVKSGKKKAMHYPIATRYRERKRKYKKCFLGICGKTKTEYHRSFYLHMGWGGSGNGWYRVKGAFAAFAARKK